MMSSQNKQLAVLSEAEKAAFYECPDFDEAQRFEYLTLTEEELQIALSADFYHGLQTPTPKSNLYK